MADNRFVPLLSRGDRSGEGYEPMGTAGNDVEVGAAEPPLPSPSPASQTNKASHIDVPGSAVFAPAPADEPLSWPSWVFIAFIVVAGVLASIASGSPGPVFIVYVVAVAPGVLVFMLIAYRLRDPIVSKSFLIGQVFIGAIPGIILVFIVETVISVIGVLVVLGDDAARLTQQYANGIKDIPGGKNVGAMTPEQKRAYDEAVDLVWQGIKNSIPFWKIILIILIEAFLVAALTEEMAKYLVGRRFRRLDGKGIGCHGVIACVSSAALGLAATEHVMYSVGYISTNGILGGLFSSVLRAVIAIPLHVGTGFYMGTRMARYAILKEPKVYFLKTIGIPVLFHGTMDFYAFFAAAEARSLPVLSILATPLDIVLVVFLLLICRRNFREVMELEAGKEPSGVSDPVDNMTASDVTV